MADRRGRLGRSGEDAVAAWYEDRGYVVVSRNWRCAAGELDLVLLGDAGTVVVFCEVKTRSSAAFGSPFEAVTASKQRRLRHLAGRWMAEARRTPHAPSPLHLRIDVAGVHVLPGGRLVVEVVEDAC